MSLDFVAIDFETANMFRGSPCAVGMITVRDGQVVDQWEQYIYQEYFDGFCISIHGITPDDVEDAPEWADIWPVIEERIGDLPLVAHNAAFDTGVLRDANTASGLPWPTLNYACTLVASRRTYDLPSYRLPFVADAAGFPFDPETHHKALHDAIASAWIMFDIAHRADATTVLDTLANLNIRLGHITPEEWIGCSSRAHRARAGFGLTTGDITINPDADPNNPLYGMGVTFTGALSSMTRALAWQRVADCGGLPLDNVTKKTNLLVFGYQDARKLAPNATMSSKFQKALALKEKDADIEIIGEDDFLAMLQEAGLKPSAGQE